jgi:hypothetical protein
MDKTKLASHTIIWGLIAVGVILSFYFFPPGLVLPKYNFLSILVIPAVAYWVYGVLGHAQIKRDIAKGIYMIEEMSARYDYGMLSHPVCIANVLLAWGIFFLYPDIRIMVSAIWMSVIIGLWMRLERNARTKPYPKNFGLEDDITP